jgi:hypothetical protein
MAVRRTIKAIGNFLLILLALVLLMVFAPIGFFFSLFVSVSDKFLFSTAISLDCLGNVLCGELLNRTMIKKDGYEFGSYKETISKVLGINKYYGKLTPDGKSLADLLNFIDKNHVEKASGLWKDYQ